MPIDKLTLGAAMALCGGGGGEGDIENVVYNTANSVVREIAPDIIQDIMNKQGGSNLPLSGSNSVQMTNCSATGIYSFAEGYGTTASGEAAHSEGRQTTASAAYAHAEGLQTEAKVLSSHAEGMNTSAEGMHSHAEGYQTTAAKQDSHAEGSSTKAQGISSHAEGSGSQAVGECSHAEGKDTVASGNYSHAEGRDTKASYNYSHAEGNNTTASGIYSHAEGNNTTVSGSCSHAEGSATKAQGLSSHAEGDGSQATGQFAHAEGKDTVASGDYSHAEGCNTKASYDYSHAEGFNTTASGRCSHAEGFNTTASSYLSHAEGSGSVASGQYSHAQGLGTEARGLGQSTLGKFNIVDEIGNGRYAEIVGNGRDENNRSNARTLDWSGNEELSGNLTIYASGSKRSLIDFINSTDRSIQRLDANLESARINLSFEDDNVFWESGSLRSDATDYSLVTQDYAKTSFFLDPSIVYCIYADQPYSFSVSASNGMYESFTNSWISSDSSQRFYYTYVNGDAIKKNGRMYRIMVKKDQSMIFSPSEALSKVHVVLRLEEVIKRLRNENINLKRELTENEVVLEGFRVGGYLNNDMPLAWKIVPSDMGYIKIFEVEPNESYLIKSSNSTITYAFFNDCKIDSIHVGSTFTSGQNEERLIKNDLSAKYLIVCGDADVTIKKFVSPALVQTSCITSNIENSMIATKPYAAGELVIVSSSLFKTINQIASGDSLSSNNVQQTTLFDFISGR